MSKYSDVSLELRNKIRKDMIIYNDIFGSGDLRGVVNFTNNELHLFQECLLWHEVVMTYFKTAYDCYKMTRIGRFLGVRPTSPTEIISESEGTLTAKMEFHVDECEEESWRDWFDIEGNNDGVLKGSLGTVINQRTHPQYYDRNGKYIFDKE